MNIFIMILAAFLMVGMYMIGAPSQRVAEQETQNAIMRSDLRTIAECAASAHNATIRGAEFVDICTEQNQIVSRVICLNSSKNVTECEVTRGRGPAFSYMVTATAPIDPQYYNSMIEVLEDAYPNAGTFGILTGNQIVSGGTSSKRVVPKGIMTELELQDGQLVYLTQFDMTDAAIEYEKTDGADLICPVGTIKTYRFGRWQCISYNAKTNCGGDMIWDSYLMECVPDESRRPLCTAPQTAVMVDDVWECVSPFPEKKCPTNMTARLNYTTLEWECVQNPDATPEVSKCSAFAGGMVTGGAGATLRLTSISCTDCERMVTDEKTCASHCVPDPEKLKDPRCYPGDTDDCDGASRAFYFGFPSRAYAKNVTEIEDYALPLDKTHSQNRMFNCMDCGERGIDDDMSLPPYIVVCK